MRINTVLKIYMLAVVALLTACKDDDIPALEYQQQGFVKGTINGVASDNKTIINKSYEYTQFAPGLYPNGAAYSYYQVKPDGTINIRVLRQDIATGGYLSMGFSLSNDTDTSPDGINYTFQYTEKSDPYISFGMESGENDITITDFSFEKSSGHLKGKFEITGSANSTGNDARVTGEIDVVIKEVIQ
ncbi:MAG TPA: hypothetical protein VIN08_02420 [Ohtaekwangia sp.]|uniref:hypothetical protein n=1 Tax=Ohtaekwangia sp. TaxID=2066019 RepID=UPI002F959217